MVITDTAATMLSLGSDDAGSTSAAPSFNTNIGGTHPNQNIFSERVARALAVRTDTTAMKTALEALSQLQLHHYHHHQQQQEEEEAQGSSSSTSHSKILELGRIITSTSLSGGAISASSTDSPMMMTIDSRSVRTVMEYDALQQAVAVQASVGDLWQIMTQLHDHCASIVTTAQLIRATIQDDNSDVVGDDPTTTRTVSGGETESPQQQQQQHNEEYSVATLIHNTIQQRDMIQTQVQTLQLFVQQYNLSDHDVYLLEHYNNFDNDHATTITSSNSVPMHHHQSEDGNNSNNHDSNDGMGFLKALQRIRQIRLALQEKFGSASSATTENSSTTGTTTTTTTTTALQLMEQLSVQQENAYERLYHWLQQYLQRNTSHTTTGGMVVDSGNDHPNTVTSGNYHQPNDFVLYAIQALKYMTAPYYYNHCVELMAAQRRTVVTRTFLMALTVGITDTENDIHQPPLEMKSYDSVAYVGDVLAFAFKSFTLEADLTKNLLLYQLPLSETDNNTSAEGSNDDRFDESQSGKTSLETTFVSEVNDNYDTPEEKALSTTDMLSISMSGIVRPLKSRILQVIAGLCRRNDTHEGVVDSDDDDNVFDKYNANDQEDDGSHIRTRVGQLYDICGLLLFYYTTILRSVSKLSVNSSALSVNNSATKNNELNPLLDCIMECFVEATQGYEATVRVYCAMMDQIAILSGESIATLMQRLIVLLIQIRTNSPGYLEDVTQECPDATCQETLSMEWVTEILISTCCNIPTISIDDVVTMKESFQITKRNTNIQFDASRAIQLETMLAEKEKELVDILIRTETSNVFDLCGLTIIADGWGHYKKEATASNDASSPNVPMSTYPGLTPHELEMGIKEFYTSLYSPPIPSLEMTIHDPSQRKLVRTNIANAIVSFYAELYTAVQNNQHSYDDATRRLFQHTPQEVQTLFSV